MEEQLKVKGPTLSGVEQESRENEGGELGNLFAVRPEEGQSSVQAAANNSPQIKQLKSIQAAANASSQVRQLKAMQQGITAGLVQRKANSTGLPDQLKSGMEHLSGMNMEDVRVHLNSSKPAQLQAHAYAQGSEIHVAPGQEQHLAHEAWHVVQQRQGRVQATTNVGGAAVNDSPALEQEADVMGAKALQMKVDESPMQLMSASSLGGAAPIQRRIAYDNAVNDLEEDTIEELRTRTVAGNALVSAIEAHGLTCTVHWAASRQEEMYAQPTNMDAACDPTRGSDVRVNVPRLEGAGAGDKYDNMLVDGGDQVNKMPALMVTHHELVHAHAAMRGLMENLNVEVVHSVLNQDGALVRKEVIPLEEVLTVGFRNSENHTHQFHNPRTGADMTNAIAAKALARGSSENELRDEKDAGIRSAYVSNPEVVPPTDRGNLIAEATRQITEKLDEIKASVLSVKMYHGLLKGKRADFSEAWKNSIDTAEGRVEAWKAEITARKARSLRPLIDNLETETHGAWHGRLQNEIAYLEGRHTLFKQNVLGPWQRKYMRSR